MADLSTVTTSQKLSTDQNMTNEDVSYEKENRTCMHGLIRQARYCLEEFIKPDLEKEKQIPFQVLNEAKGIVFLTMLKGGIGVGGIFGTGIIMVRDKENSQIWNGPISVALNGIQLGFTVGVQQSDHIIILHDDKDIDTFLSSGQLRFEGDASISFGTIGHDVNIALSLNDKGYISSSSYSLTKGAYVGITVEGQALLLQEDCNEEYFGTKINPLEVLNGTIKRTEPDEDYNSLCQTLNDYIFKQKSEYLSTFIEHEMSSNETKNAAPTITNDDKNIVQNS